MAAELRNDAERSVDQLLDWCCAGAPARSTGRPGVLRFVVQTETGAHTRHVTVSDDGARVRRYPPCPPNSTVQISKSDLTRLALGEMRGSLAFSTGALQVEGDVVLAVTWLDQLRSGQ
ncbi:SCP2 sterol-binding domain-containing protein [Streptomyces boninensis]|uniref:SCP2 sterol-binding domain-containing protein n=1 Tax=Streptomyces boninensis TaxID=2039455 RepID=UPI003B21FBA7